jgi:cytochrome c-type biogenesis protein CcmE
MSTNRTVKIALSVATLGGALGYLLYSTAGEAFEYYKHVDEVAANRADWRGKPMKLHGYVVPGSIQRRFDKDHGRLEYKFREVNCGQELEVTYAGTVPDTFKDGAEVVVKGEIEGDHFHSTEVMAKCPSKYQATAGPSNMCTRGKAD